MTSSTISSIDRLRLRSSPASTAMRSCAQSRSANAAASPAQAKHSPVDEQQQQPGGSADEGKPAGGVAQQRRAVCQPALPRPRPRSGFFGRQSISGYLGAVVYWPNQRAKASPSRSAPVTMRMQPGDGLGGDLAGVVLRQRDPGRRSGRRRRARRARLSDQPAISSPREGARKPIE